MNWRAKYHNGETVTDDDGLSSDRLNRVMLQEFTVMDNGLPIHTIELNPERKHFYRRRVSMRPGEGNVVVHILGYKEGNSWHIAAIHEDHKVEIFDSFNKVHPYMYPPRFLPHEEIS